MEKRRQSSRLSPGEGQSVKTRISERFFWGGGGAERREDLP